MKKLTAKQKKIISIAWKQVENFIKDWQKSPFEYSTERDIQADIASRLKGAYKIKNWHTLLIKSKNRHTPKPYDKQGFICSRVCCEPGYYHKKGEFPRKPDIVVLDDLKSPEHLPDEDKKGNRIRYRNYKALWVCEIKYYHEWNKAFIDFKHSWDAKKLYWMHRRRDGARYGCWLYVHRIRPKSYKQFIEKGYRKRDGYMMRPITKDGRYVAYFVTLPPEKR